MAKAEPAAAPADADAAPKKKNKLLLIIVAVVIVAVAGGGAFLFLKKKNHAAEGEGEEPAKIEKKAKADPGKPPTFVNLEPFTVNLTPDPAEHYMQAAVVLKLDEDKAAEQIKAYMPEVRDRVLMLLASQKATDLATKQGRMDLAAQIKDETNSVVGTPGRTDKQGRTIPPEGPVTAVLFTSFIIQ